MKQNIEFDKETIRWWGIFALCLTALILFIFSEYQTALQNTSTTKIEPENFNAIITKSTIALALALAILTLAWRPLKERQKKSSQNIEHDNNSWLKHNLPFGVALWSDEGNLIDCNSQYRARLNLDLHDTVCGNSYVKTMKKVKAKNGYKIISDEALIRQLELTHHNGSSSLIDERPLNNGGFISLIFDNTEIVKTKQELKELQSEQRELTKQLHAQKIKAEAASRSKTSFLAHLSHDVRTPLNHIIGFSDIISHEVFGSIGDKRYLEYINEVKSSGEKLLNSFSEILELAQLEGGDLVLKPEDIELAKILQATVNRHQASAKRAGLKIELNTPDEVILNTDKMCLERMISNIIENSIRFTPSGGVIKLNAWLAEDGVVFEISDTGIGIAPERLKDLSEPFVLGDSAFTREGGVGLGIAISRSIAELNGGELAIDSSPAIGTTVAISLPTKITKIAKQSNVA